MRVLYWNRYEAENYFITPELLAAYAAREYSDATLFGGHKVEINRVLRELTIERVFSGNAADYVTYESLPGDARRLIWETQTQRIKLSDFAEEFFRRLATEIGDRMLLTKGELHRLVELVPPGHFVTEVREKLEALNEIFTTTR